MTNEQIKKALQHKRAIADFARFLNMTPQGIYKLLNSKKQKDNQYLNFIFYLINRFTA